MATTSHWSSSTSPQSTNLTPESAQTHTRTYQACIPCRNRKVRCDLGPVDHPHEPPCFRCRRESKECYFSTTRRKRKLEGSAEGSGDVEPDDYEIRNGRKKLRQDSNEPPSRLISGNRARTSSASQGSFNPPLTPGGHTGNSRPLKRPGSQPLHSSDEDERIVNHDTTKMIQYNEVFHQGDALYLLAEAGKRDANVKRERSKSFEGTIKTNSPKMTTANTSNPTAVKAGRNGSFLPTTVGLNAKSRSSQYDHDSNEAGIRAAHRAWSKVRFVKAGWFTAAEGMSFIDYFYKFLCPMTPITVPDFRDPAKHGKLIRDEPMLALTILTIASRYLELPGPGSKSRAYKIHDELWRDLKQKILCVILAEDKSRGSFSGAGVVKPATPGRPPGLRTLGTIESFLLLTEWHPRSLHFPGGDDNDGIMSSDENGDYTENPSGDVTQDLHGRNIDSWLAPCLRSERMCWKLLSIAMALAFELRIFDKIDPESSDVDDPTSSYSRGENIKKLLFIYITQTSGRLTLKSMLPDSESNSSFSVDPLQRAYEARRISYQSSKKPPPELVQQAVLYFWCEVTRFMKDGNRDAFPTREETRKLIASGQYVDTLNLYNTRLAELRERFENCDLIPPEMRHVLTIELEYNRVYCNSLALHAVVERCTQYIASGSNPTSSASKSDKHPSIQNGVIPPDVLSEWCDGDRGFINEIIIGGQNVLQCVGEVLGPNGMLKFAPVRTFFRIISVSMVFLKCFTLGQRSEDAGINLKMLDEASEALRTCIVDDVHVASRIADLLQILNQRVRSSVVRFGGNNGATGPNSTVTSRVPTPGASSAGLRGQQYPRATSNGATTAFEQGREILHRHQGPESRQNQQPYMATPTSAQTHTPNGMYGHAPIQTQYAFSHGQYLPTTPGPYHDNPLYGIDPQDYDPTNPNHSMIPPASFNYPNGGHFATGNNNGSQSVANNSSISESGNLDNGAVDWLALPLDPLLESSGAELSQTGWGPVLNEIDILDFYNQQYA